MEWQTELTEEKGGVGMEEWEEWKTVRMLEGKVGSDCGVTLGKGWDEGWESFGVEEVETGAHWCKECIKLASPIYIFTYKFCKKSTQKQSRNL
jgi:hypothetical protein